MSGDVTGQRVLFGSASRLRDRDFKEKTRFTGFSRKIWTPSTSSRRSIEVQYRRQKARY
jgi:hypothetical protein